jgi:hypothetical protein
MRKPTLALFAAATLAMLGTAPAGAVGTRHPFCMQGDEVPGLSDCSYASYEQCQATASGRLLYCIANPYYVPGGDRAPSAHRHRHVKSAYPSR